MSEPLGIAFDSQHNIYVLNVNGTGYVQKFNPTGNN